MTDVVTYLSQFPKRKGRKPKQWHDAMKKYMDISNNSELCDLSNHILIFPDEKNATDENGETKQPKKRGRRPKGGKVVEVKNILVDNIPIPNIILHLKCKLSDIYDEDGIKYEPNLNDIQNYDIDGTANNLKFNFIENEDNTETNNDNVNTGFIINVENKENITVNETKQNTEYLENINFKKNISKKLKELTYNLKHNNINNRSSCFWCTHPFDNEPIFIPKYQLQDKFFVYGCFCSPECACSHLMNENIDTSSKFERYYLLNNIYGKIYHYNKNIKPAPSPYYLLNNYYGNLDIQEYRKLLENERLLLVVDKPLSQILPEVYEENEDFLTSARIVSKSGTIGKNHIKK